MKVIAVIGCGRIANNAHLPALSELENVRIKYACDLIRRGLAYVDDLTKEEMREYRGTLTKPGKDCLGTSVEVVRDMLL